MYLGIDFGTSGVRAIAIDANQTIIAESKIFYDLSDIHTWKLALETVINQIPLDVRQKLKAIALDGTSSTVLICDAWGEPIYQPLLYSDRRGSEVLTDLARIAPVGNITISSTSALAKLLWLVENLEFSFKNHYFLHQADWIAYLLHGQLGISDYHNALKLGYDLQNLEYPHWLRSLEISNLLPKVLCPGQAIAPIQPQLAAKWQVNPECLICAGTTDSTASFIASGADMGEAVTSLGSTLVLKILSSQHIENVDFGVYSHRFGNLWLVGGGSNSGGAVLKQFFTDAELENLSADILAHLKEFTSNLNYYPLPQIGERFPINDPQLLPRLEPRPQSDRQFLYALLEGIAKIESQGYNLLQELGAPAPTRIFTTGGGAKNLLWTAIRQKYLKAEIIPSVQTEAAYGSAILALNGFSNSN